MGSILSQVSTPAGGGRGAVGISGRHANRPSSPAFCRFWALFIAIMLESGAGYALVLG
jgi:hypothetical protein